MGPFTLKKEERILRRAEFIDLSLHGKKYYSKNFVVLIAQNRKDIARLGINVSKRVGNSVKRNRIKRAIREFFRHNKERIPKGYDILVVALKDANKSPFLGVQEELGGLLLKNDDLFS